MQGSSPKTWYQVQGKGYRSDRQGHADQTQMGHRAVVGKTDEPQKIQGQEGEDGNP